MTDFEIWLLAVSLAMDCFTVAVTTGIIIRKTEWQTILPMAGSFGFFQAMMTLLGWLGASHFRTLIQAYDHWISFGLLAFIGIKMIKDYFTDKKKLCFNPRSKRVMLALSIATSIDAMAVGISFAFLGFHTLRDTGYPLFAIGITSLLLSLVGAFTGILCGKRYQLRMELWAGLILIAIGTKILIEHLYFNH